MPIEVEDLDGALTKMVLPGRIDVTGAQEIDVPMSIVAGSRKALVIDLSPQPMVEEVITVNGIDELIPIHRNEAAAMAGVQPAPV